MDKIFIMYYLKISIGIFLALAASRLIPHPPNFTSLIALSFYVPALLGLSYLPALIICFFLTDLIIGFHSVTFFTWGSVILIGFLSQFFKVNIMNRISGSLLGACLFFIITNFGVWSLGSYGYSLSGFITCYNLALPFFGYTLVSTVIFSFIIEVFLKISKIKSAQIN
ncbi:hypothetical protein N9A34_04220 [Candidatus Pelagibacter sp.]|nr:hypothetical protein [Candidatus Pelagibacter sp.]